MTVLTCVILALCGLLWMFQLQIGVGVGMASSWVKEGSPQDVYLGRVDTVRGMVALGILLAFISQFIDHALVRTGGIILLTLSFLGIVIVWSGLLRFRLPVSNEPQEDPFVVQARVEKRLTDEGWTTQRMDDRRIIWLRPEKQQPTDVDEAQDDL